MNGFFRTCSEHGADCDVLYDSKLCPLCCANAELDDLRETIKTLETENKNLNLLVERLNERPYK